MLQATAKYQALTAISVEEHADLLERLQKPYEQQGAFDEDQHDEPYISEVYTRDILMDGVLIWMEDDFSRVSIISRLGTTPSASRSILGRYGNSVNNDAPLGDFGGLDDFAAGFSLVPLAKVALRTQQYL